MKTFKITVVSGNEKSSALRQIIASLIANCILKMTYSASLIMMLCSKRKQKTLSNISDLRVILIINSEKCNYLLKVPLFETSAILESNLELLPTAINKLLNNQRFIQPELKLLIEEKLGQSPVAKEYELTRRELEVLKCVKNKFLNKEIARHLKISIRTVETHRSNLKKKLNVKNNAELLEFCFKNL
jgi:DNA-binding NarL/FixJ family response regulator